MDTHGGKSEVVVKFTNDFLAAFSQSKDAALYCKPSQAGSVVEEEIKSLANAMMEMGPQKIADKFDMSFVAEFRDNKVT